MMHETGCLQFNKLPRREYKGVQLLRFFAALLVLVMHASLYASERLNPIYASIIWDPGSSGVDIFFVISGFVIAIGSQGLEHHRSGWKDFAVRRGIRIIPLYWIMTFAKIILVFAIPASALHSSFDFVHIGLSFLFLPAKAVNGTIFPYLGVGWTLNFEFLFYFLFCLALFLHRSTFKFCLFVLCAFALLSMLRKPDWPPVSFYFDPITIEFLFGLAIAKATISGKTPSTTASVLLALTGVLLIVLPPQILFELPRLAKRGIPALMLVAGVVFLEDKLLFRIPHKILFLGEASFAIYLSHPFVAPIPPTLLRSVGVDNLFLSMSMSIILATYAGCILWRFVDKPIHYRLKKLLAKGTRDLQSISEKKV